MTTRLQFSLISVALVCSLIPAPAQVARLPGVIYMDQPGGIDLAIYETAWPNLKVYTSLIRTSGISSVEVDLKHRFLNGTASDGELNLLAQIEWQHGELDAAEAAATRAIALNPLQSLNSFQQAMVYFARLRASQGWIEQWKWQRATRDAYQRTFELDPRNTSARYYLAYSLMNTPWIGGGDSKKALQLSDEGIALGQVGFYAVRADAHRVRGEIDAANADYDIAITLHVIKLGGFLDAAQEEIKRREWDRAKRYLDWSLHCRPDATQVYEAYGDFYSARGDKKESVKWYQGALAHDPNNKAARAKLN